MLDMFFFKGKKYESGGGFSHLSEEKQMAIADVMKLKEYATKISEVIHDKDDVEAWVISKIAKVEQTTANVKHTLEAKYPNKFEQGGEVNSEHSDGEIVRMMLLHIGKYAKKMLEGFEKEDVELDSWMYHELAIAGGMIDSVFHYMDYFVNHTKLENGEERYEHGGMVEHFSAPDTTLQQTGELLKKGGFIQGWEYNGHDHVEITYSGDTKYTEIKADFPSLTDEDFDELEKKGSVEADGYEIHGERGYSGINFIAEKKVRKHQKGGHPAKVLKNGYWVVYNVETGELIGDKLTSKAAAEHKRDSLINKNTSVHTIGVVSYREWCDENVFKKGGALPFPKKLKVGKVMHEFKEGNLYSHGKKVTDRKQAIAIALHEAGLSKYQDGGEIESFRLPDSDEYPTSLCGIPDYNTALDRWALYYKHIA